MIVVSYAGDGARGLGPVARRVARGLWVWGPIVVWLGVIALTSGEVGAHANSDVWVWRVVHEWLPSLLGIRPSAAAPSFLPWWVRKSAHVAEYAVLGALTARTFLRSVAPGPPRRPGPPRGGRLPGRQGLRAAVVICLPLCGVVAIIDEFHQSALASRTGSPRDVAFDLVGAALGLGAGWLVWRRG